MCIDVIHVQTLPNFQMELAFANGEKRRYNMRPLLTVKPWDQIASEQLFKQAKVAYGTVVWPNEIDIAPETLYIDSVGLWRILLLYSLVKIVVLLRNTAFSECTGGMLSYEEFQRLSDVEDAMWLQSAQEAAAGGYLSAAETDDFFKKKATTRARSLYIALNIRFSWQGAYFCATAASLLPH